MSDVSTDAAACLRSDSQLRTGSCTCGELHAGTHYVRFSAFALDPAHAPRHSNECSLYVRSKQTHLTATCIHSMCAFAHMCVRMCVCVCVYVNVYVYVSFTHPTIVRGTETQGKHEPR